MQQANNWSKYTDFRISCLHVCNNNKYDRFCPLHTATSTASFSCSKVLSLKQLFMTHPEVRPFLQSFRQSKMAEVPTTQTRMERSWGHKPLRIQDWSVSVSSETQKAQEFLRRAYIGYGGAIGCNNPPEGRAHQVMTESHICYMLLLFSVWSRQCKIKTSIRTRCVLPRRGLGRPHCENSRLLGLNTIDYKAIVSDLLEPKRGPAAKSGLSQQINSRFLSTRRPCEKAISR